MKNPFRTSEIAPFDAAREVQLARSDLRETGIHVIKTDCCGYVPNNEGVGAPLYMLASDEELSKVEAPIAENSDQLTPEHH